METQDEKRLERPFCPSLWLQDGPQLRRPASPFQPSAWYSTNVWRMKDHLASKIARGPVWNAASEKSTSTQNPPKHTQP
ncbi:hypothetical protein MUG91_G179n20 [Manis pentadactyla]|nr:hypothetical protein MUG91_G179n20 [Manis pentadactyla]